MLNLDELSKLGDRELLSAIESALGSERTALSRLVVYLGEVEQRRIHLVRGYASLFEFCTVALRLSEGEAFRRINAARLARRFPIIIELIATGAQHLSGLVLLRDHLTESSHAELLAESSNKSKRQIGMLLAVRAPKPDAPARIRRLPSRQSLANAAPVGVASAAAAPAAPEPSRNAESERNAEFERNAEGKTESGRNAESERKTEPEAEQKVVGESELVRDVQLAPGPERRRERDRARVEALSRDRYRLQLTLSGELRDKLEHATNLLSHANPSHDLGVVVERAIDLLIEKLEMAVLAKRKTKRAVGSREAKDPGAVPRRERRAVFERDGMQCTYVGPDGRRCTAKAFLELDHVEERARGGSGKSLNLRVRCRAHNLLQAERSFGRTYIERCIDFSRRKCERSRAEPPRSSIGSETETAVSSVARSRRAPTSKRNRRSAPLAPLTDIDSELAQGESPPGARERR